MKLIFIRHGETNYNLKSLCNGVPSSKVYLTPLGKKQALSAAKKLAKSKIDVIFVSQLYRSGQTARILNKYHKAPIIMDKRLNDRSMGAFESKWVDLFYIWRDHQKNPWTCRPRGGESYEEMKKRLNTFLKDLAKKKYKTVIIVSHLPILKVARGHFKNLSNQAMDKPTEDNIPNCKIMRFTLPTKF